MASQSSKQNDHAPLNSITCLQNRPLSNPLYIYGLLAFHLQFYPHIICNNIFTINCFKHQENLVLQFWVITEMDRCEVQKAIQIKRVSVFQADELFLNRIESRTSSVGCSSRVYYYRSSEGGVPFEWEMQPGTPKEPPKEEVLPPLSPPPAVISLGLPKPSINEEPSKPPMSRPLRLKFWKRSKKYKSKESGGGGESHSKHVDHKLEFCSSDREFMASPPRNSSSSSSSSLSFSKGFYRDASSRLQSPAREPLRRPALSCSPWNVSAILVSIARRV